MDVSLTPFGVVGLVLWMQMLNRSVSMERVGANNLLICFVREVFFSPFP